MVFSAYNNGQDSMWFPDVFAQHTTVRSLSDDSCPGTGFCLQKQGLL